MKSHFYSSSLSGRPIPEEEEVLAYMTSSSCSSLEENENGCSFRYPPDLLGVSWGSYLQSDPPTRAGRSPKKVVINTTLKPLQSKVHLPPADQAPARSILRTPVAKESTIRKLPEELLGEPHPLMHDLHVLIDEVTSSREEMRRCGIDTTPLSNFCDSLTTENYDLKQLVDQLGDKRDAGKDVLLGGVLKLVIQFLRSVLRSIVEEGKRLQEQATFLQHTGKQLNKLQQNFMKEQEEVQQAMENTKAQLTLEKHDLEEQKEALEASQEELQRFYCGRRTNSTHIIASTMPGYTQTVALVQTQKEQTRLEKVLLQQQKEIRNLQRAHELTKAELVTAQEHAHRMQQKLANTSKDAKRNAATLSTQLQSVKESLAKTSMELDREKRKSQQAVTTVRQRENVLRNVTDISTAQKALHHGIGRMKRQFSEQQRRDYHLQQQLRVNSQRLGETRSRVKQHTYSRLGGQLPLPEGHHPLAGRSARRTKGPPPYKSHTHLPRINYKSQKRSKPVPSAPVALPKLPQATPTSSTTEARRKNLPYFRFSKSELFTLARFEDQETADQVLHWLGLQGKLAE